MDQITQAYIVKLENERDAAIDHAAELELDNQELSEANSILLAQLIRVQQEASYPVEVA